jgi:hypothetical protein
VTSRSYYFIGREFNSLFWVLGATTFSLMRGNHLPVFVFSIDILDVYGLQVTAWVSDMFCNFDLVKNHKIAHNSTTTKANEKNKHRFGILGIF